MDQLTLPSNTLLYLIHSYLFSVFVFVFVSILLVEVVADIEMQNAPSHKEMWTGAEMVDSSAWFSSLTFLERTN